MKGVYSVSTIRSCYLNVVITSAFEWYFPSAGQFIVFSMEIFFIIDAIPVSAPIAKKILYKIVNYISRNPWRTKRNINIICRYGRGNDFFNCLYIFSKISVVFFIGFFISTTLNIYTDVTKELRKSEFEGLDSYFKNEYNKVSV